MIYELRQKYLTIMNIAVAADQRRRGVGSAMIDKLKGKLSPRRRAKLLLEVSDRNLAAHLWLKSCGLLATRVSPVVCDDYDEPLDCYRFEWHHLDQSGTL